MTDRTSAEDAKRVFDPMVLRAMAKWPDVPECYGWLALDRRGRWRLRGGAVTNRKAVAFINRHYASDATGRWYFQNGPQRVFVDLDYTPWVYMLAGNDELATHTGLPVRALRRLHVDADGNLLLETEHGIGLLCDRDLPAFVDAASCGAGADGDVAALLAKAAHGGRFELRWRGRDVAAGPIEAGEVAARFGFVPHPEPTT